MGGFLYPAALSSAVFRELLEKEADLKAVFEDFKKVDVHALLFRPEVNIHCFDARGHKKFDDEDSVFDVGPKHTSGT